MRNQVYIDRGMLELLYYNNKPYIIPVFTIGVCVLLFFQLIIPQFQDVLTVWERERQLAKGIEMYKNNLAVLEKIPSSTVDNDLRVVSSVLPPHKDFEGVFATISNAAGKSQVKVGDYSLSVGKLELDSNSPKVLETNLPVSLNVSGSISGIRSFIKTLYLSGPIARISSVNFKDDSSSVKLFFYYKPFPFLSIDYNKKITDLSKLEKDKIQEFSSWNTVAFAEEAPLSFQTPGSTRSGELSP